jgi:hypothetical protein
MRWSPLLPWLLLLAPVSAQEWIVLPPDSVQTEPGGATQVLEDGSILVSAAPGLQRIRVECLVDMDVVGSLRLETLSHDSLPGNGPGHGAAGNYGLSEMRVRSVVGRTSRWMSCINPTASEAAVGWPAGAAIDTREGTAWSPGPGRGPQELVVQFEEVLGRGRRTLVLDLEFHTGGTRSLGCFRISVSPNQNNSAKGEAAQWGKTQLAINAAIDKGVAYLLQEQDLDGSWADQQDRYTTGATALVVYALLKSGVPKEHQAVRRALAYLAARPPRYTYEAGTQLMAFLAADRVRWKDHAAGILDELLDWQIGDWGYPGGHGDPSSGHKDLSNTQYGALGLWAAKEIGLDVPTPAWVRLAERVLLYQTSDGGFGYVPGGGATGSMSAAGVTVLSLCLPQLSKGKAFQHDVEVAQRSGLGWLDRNFSPTTNLGQGNAWFHYYMYGIERVGAFAEVDIFNGQNWYREGARQLLKQQRANGSWGDPWGREHSTTSYCLLFLNRASAPKSGPGGGRSVVTYGDDNPEEDVSLRASGDSPVTFWVSSFGDKLFNKYVFEGEDEIGLRVKQVDYLTGGGVLLADSRQGGAEWSYSTKAPADGWAEPVFDMKGWKVGTGAFGPKDSPRLTVGTTWTSKEIWLRKELDLQPHQLTNPELTLNFGAGVDGVQGALVKLFDEEGEFVSHLSGGSGTALNVSEDASSGSHYLRVMPRQKYRVRIPGWGFPIRAKPGEGEYRYIQFAWRKPANNVMVQLAIDGAWGRSVRYFAGENQVAFNPAIEITSRAPERWTVVTRDLWADMGKDGFVTGISLTAMDNGEADFDAFYLAQSKSDFRRKKGILNDIPEWEAVNQRGPKPAELGACTLYLNGTKAVELDWETDGFETVLADEELKDLLVPGTNLIAVHARNSESGRSLDLSLLASKLLATAKGNPEQAKRGKRYAARFSMPRPGEYDVWARVHVVDEATGMSVAADSKPLRLDIRSALDPKMLEYATDGLRNEMSGMVERVEASSFIAGWEPNRAVNNNQTRGWVSMDGDAAPEISVHLTRPVRADVLLLSHTRVIRADASRTALATRVEVTINDRGAPMIVTLRPGRLTKTSIHFGRPQKVRSLRVKIVGQTEGEDPTLTGVGFAEIELQLQAR